ncbi:hypothetical protein [Acinetobacter terrae]|uniref:Uncharacterized protein n=1 Tax=Acinetobacter terrae TaxID=2731247 RepID=A0ABX1UZM3_9GAMM|nr:hypothetical protein [Acinetobacter terrae]NNH86213.1 hypothetical protein [Acinetobacter terrae]
MNQIPSHSQTPEFDTNKSQTTAILYQQPTFAEQRTSIKDSVKAVLKDLAAISLVLVTIGSVVLTVRSCADDVDRQEQNAVKHQLQFQTSNGGTR